MAFSIKFTDGVGPGKKLQTLKRSTEEIYDARCGGINKRTNKFQTNWMKDRPWLFRFPVKSAPSQIGSSQIGPSQIGPNSNRPQVKSASK